MKIDFYKYRFVFLGLLISIYLIIVCWWYNSYKNLLTTDGVEYLTISQRYLDGDFSRAVNGYWSPLISWALIPVLAVLKNGPLAFKLVNIIAGGSILVLLFNFFLKKGIHILYAFLSLVTLTPFLVHCAYSWLTPDLPSALLILLLLLKTGTDIDLTLLKNQIKIAAIIAIAYHCKAYNLVALLAFFSVFILLSPAYSFPKRLFILSKTTFFIVCFVLPWVTIISLKYRKPTISTATSYNFALAGPKSAGHPFYHFGPKVPAHQLSSLWEDPTYMHIRSWHPFKNKREFDYLKNKIAENALDLFNRFIKPGWFLFLFSYLLAIPAFYFSRDRIFIWLMIFPFIYCSLYLIIFIELRYIWSIYLAAFINFAYATWILSKWFRPLLLAGSIVCLFLFSSVPFNEELRSHAGQNDIDYEIYQRVLQNDPGCKNTIIASEHNTWLGGLLLSYYTNSTFINSFHSKEQLNKCKDLGAKYFFAFKDDEKFAGAGILVCEYAGCAVYKFEE